MQLFHKELTGVLNVRNFDEVSRFYESIGLSKTAEWTAADGSRRVKYYVTGGGHIEIHENDESLKQGPTSFWMEAKDIDGVYSAMQKMGTCDLFDPIEDKYFHARSFQMRDPAGNAAYIVSYEQNVLPYTCDSVSGDFFKDEFRTVFFVVDLDACKKYYTEVLEMPCVYSWDECKGDRGFKYQAAGTESYIENLHRIPLTDQNFANIKLTAVDFDACYERISNKSEANIVQDTTINELGQKQFMLEDPDGNRIIICS